MSLVIIVPDGVGISEKERRGSPVRSNQPKPLLAGEGNRSEVTDRMHLVIFTHLTWLVAPTLFQSLFFFCQTARNNHRLSEIWPVCLDVPSHHLVSQKSTQKELGRARLNRSTCWLTSPLFYFSFSLLFLNNNFLMIAETHSAYTTEQKFGNTTTKQETLCLMEICLPILIQGTNTVTLTHSVS